MLDQLKKLTNKVAELTVKQGAVVYNFNGQLKIAAKPGDFELRVAITKQALAELDLAPFDVPEVLAFSKYSAHKDEFILATLKVWGGHTSPALRYAVKQYVLKNKIEVPREYQ